MLKGRGIIWETEYIDEFGGWRGNLSEPEQEDIAACVKTLESAGPDLKFPYSSHTDMRELRIQHKGQPYQALYVFDPSRNVKIERIDSSIAKKFSELFNKMSPKVQKVAIEKSKKTLSEMPLRELRQAHKLSQERIAEILLTKQAIFLVLNKGRTCMFRQYAAI